MPNTSISLPDEFIEDTILLIRGKRVILDHDLARLYGVATKVLNQAVKRNLDRFPEDFMFQLTKVEAEEWGSPEAFKVTNCDLEENPRDKYQVPTLCFYRAWNLDALKRAKVTARGSGKHSDHAYVRQIAPDACLE
jgi:hypothetical protein